MDVGGYQLSPRVRIQPGDAVKVAGRRGVFRFVRANDETFDVVGPVGGVEVSRTFRIADIRSAGKTLRTTVEMPADARALSDRAKSWKTRRT